MKYILIPIVFIVAWTFFFGLPIACAVIARSKNRNQIGWFSAGILAVGPVLGVVPLIIVISLQKKEVDASEIKRKINSPIVLASIILFTIVALAIAITIQQISMAHN